MARKIGKDLIVRFCYNKSGEKTGTGKWTTYFNSLEHKYVAWKLLISGFDSTLTKYELLHLYYILASAKGATALRIEHPKYTVEIKERECLATTSATKSSQKESSPKMKGKSPNKKNSNGKPKSPKTSRSTSTS